jgi:hypothetical protein
VEEENLPSFDDFSEYRGDTTIPERGEDPTVSAIREKDSNIAPKEHIYLVTKKGTKWFNP